MQTILITGGAGFIGSNFVIRLFQHYPQYRLIAVDNLTYAGKIDSLPDEIKRSPRFEFWHGNICDSELVYALMERADAVVHLAAESHVSRSIYNNRIFFETDVLGTQTVANAVVKHYKTVERFIHVSSSEVYGTATKIPLTEEHPLNPTSPYASAKAAADRLVYAYCQTYEIPAVIVRPFNNYGPRQHLEKVVARFVTRALRNEPLVVHGDGFDTRDWMYVEDCCRALDLALHAPIDRIRGEAINIGTGEELSILRVAELVLGKLDKPSSLIRFAEERLGRLRRQCASTSKAEALLGWTAEVPFEQGLQWAIEWYAANQGWWKEQVWMETVPVRLKSGEIMYY